MDELFLVWACQNKKFHFIGGSRGACLLANAERKKPGARGNPRPEVPHYMRPGYLIMLCFQAFYLSFLQHFPRSFILFIKTACRLSLDLLDYFPEELLECYPVKTWRIPSKVPVEQGLSLQQQHVVLHRILDMPFHVLVPKFVLVKCINTLKVGSIAIFVAFVFIFREIMVHYSVLWTAGGCCLGWHGRKWRRRWGGWGGLDR